MTEHSAESDAASAADLLERVARDEEFLARVCERQGLMPADGWIWEERGATVAVILEDVAAVIREGRPTPPASGSGAA